MEASVEPAKLFFAGWGELITEKWCTDVTQILSINNQQVLDLECFRLLNLEEMDA